MSFNGDDKEMYEKEFLNFLIKRIKYAGNSLRFQDLPGIVQQLRFEVRGAFGTRRSLMEFLRVHPNTFKIDSKEFSVSLIPSSALEDYEDYDRIDLVDSNKKPITTWPPNIENGTGIVEIIYPEFGVIKASEPVETYVYFTSVEYNRNKDSLLTSLDIQKKSKVSFNAIFGHQDYSINYRATKVSLIRTKKDGNSYSNINMKRNNKSNVEDVMSEGEEFSSNDKDRIKHYNKRPKSEQQTQVIKKSCSQPSSIAGSNDKNIVVKNRLENESGKIHPHSHGAIIKFGNDFSEMADGDFSEYFLLGTKVSDIRHEFLDGEEVFFDAIKIEKAPGWRATLVWTGDKPVNTKTAKCIEKGDDTNEGENCSSKIVVSSESSYSSIKSQTKKCKSLITEPITKKDIVIEHSKRNKKPCFNKALMNKPKDKMSKKHRNFHVNKRKVAKERSVAEADENSNKMFASDDDDECPYKQIVSDKNHLESSQNSSEEDSECFVNTRRFKLKDNLKDKIYINEKYEKPHLKKKFLNTESSQNSSEEDSECSANNHRFKFQDNSENNILIDEESYETPPESFKKSKNRKASIKKFEDIEGEIVRLYCKVAFVKSPHLQSEIDFVWNIFYENGKSVEEQQVIDLKEIIKVGDIVKFNYFEIIDDDGVIHQKVTVAWRGHKPIVNEMTPDEFIMEYKLSVSVLDNESIQEYRSAQDNFLTTVNSTSSDSTFDSGSKSSLNDVSEDINALSEEDDMFEDSDNLTANVNYKLVSEKIIECMKSSGLISSEAKIDVSTVIDEVSLILKNSDIEGSATLNHKASLRDSLGQFSEVLCSDCAKRSQTLTKNKTANVEVQTLLTGEIIATRDELPLPWRRTFPTK